MSEIWLLLVDRLCLLRRSCSSGSRSTRQPRAQARAVRLLESQVSRLAPASRSANLREHELTRELRQPRARSVRRPAPGGSRAASRRSTRATAWPKKLLLAGSPAGWDAERVIAFKVIGAGGGFVRSVCCSRS